jgi:HrpA-like RNA helicase
MQLPQYAAENFEGSVICTQPRALAAVDISKRIAFEFDGAR